MDDRNIRPENLVIGVLAHVDAGKTTLSEGLLYLGGTLRRMGRVDKRDTFLDTDEMERARGITIYAKQAVFASPEKNRTYTLMDTPGHADFSSETERTLSVLDAAVLLISAAEGVNARVRLLWNLLSKHRIPVIIFVNKMDQAEALGEAENLKLSVMDEIRSLLSENAADVTDGMTGASVQEAIALLSEDEGLIESVLEGGTVPSETISSLIMGRRFFPVLFGSALRMNNVDALLSLIDDYITPPSYKDGEGDFAAKVIKITRTPAGERETHLKVTGGRLFVRQSISYRPAASEAPDPDSDDAELTKEEKITQIRVYSGEKYAAVKEALPGTVCAVTGLSATYAGQGLGLENDDGESLLSPVLAWRIILPR
ncbi:MAG: GTP-binding protein, partial [Lachnospiraceae bacterium]|nr:GTP-binding protein [Lachnospiraceae bacterium]